MLKSRSASALATVSGKATLETRLLNLVSQSMLSAAIESKNITHTHTHTHAHDSSGTHLIASCATGQQPAGTGPALGPSGPTLPMHAAGPEPPGPSKYLQIGVDGPKLKVFRV